LGNAGKLVMLENADGIEVFVHGSEQGEPTEHNNAL